MTNPQYYGLQRLLFDRPHGRVMSRNVDANAPQRIGLRPGREHRSMNRDEMTIFFSVGEPSGDVHGANLVRELSRLRPGVKCVGFGGPKMKAAGCELLTDLTELAIMFLWSVIRHYFTFLGYLRQAETYFRTQPVDAVVLIDYPGFNWLIAKRAKKYGIPVYYYGVPQMWAWAPWRVAKLRRRVDHTLCKLPFEPQWFARRGVNATYVGHPFYDENLGHTPDHDFCRDFRSTSSNRTLLLLPGSRDSEVTMNWEMLRDAARHIQSRFRDVRVVVGCFREKHRRQLLEHPEAIPGEFEYFVQRTPELMSLSQACIACSGSVSLELMNRTLPTVIVYRLSPWKFWLQRYLIRAKFITLVNLMATDSIERVGRQCFDPDLPGAESVPMPEYLTSRNRAEAVAGWVSGWFSDESKRQRAIRELDNLRRKYAKTGATRRAAEYILTTMGQSTESRHSRQTRPKQVA